MSEFKIGDAVRFRDGQERAGKLKGVITSISPCVGYYRLDGAVNGYGPSLLELVPEKPKTDEELAAEYRDSVTKSRAARAELKARGYTLMFGQTEMQRSSSTPVEQFVFKKTVTTTTEI